MPKTVTIIAGLVIASAVTYKYREDIKNETRSLQQAAASSPSPLSSIDAGLEKEVDTIQHSLLNSQNYVKQRLIPSVKANWNEQITNVTHAMIDSDLPTQASRFWNKHVLGHSDRQ